MKKALFFNRLYDNLDAGELDVKAGRVTDADDVLAELKSKYVL